MNILISGASGLVGKSLVKKIRARGDTPILLSRKKPLTQDQVFWDPYNNLIEWKDELNIDAVINLSGESIADSRWNAAKKKRILDSRVFTTRTLVEELEKLKSKPKVFFSASAIGYYKSSSNELDENSEPGTDFLSQVCLAWEKEANKSSIRTVIGRIGLVLSKEGGALEKMLLPFKLGLGGKVGSGQQVWSWISLEDLVDSILFCIDRDNISGPVNLVGPSPVSNLEFTKILGEVLHRPTIFSVPAFILNVILGEMAEALIMSSYQVAPKKLKTNNFNFKNSSLKEFFVDDLHA